MLRNCINKATRAQIFVVVQLRHLRVKSRSFCNERGSAKYYFDPSVDIGEPIIINTQVHDL